jgi:RND family efflux transporter MFP subunit
MKQLLIILVWLPLLAMAHAGEDHGDAKKTATSTIGYFSSEAISDKYELLVKYGTLVPGKEAVIRLFISEYNSNKPLDSGILKISVAGNPNIKVTAIRIDKGVYELKAIFPEKKSYNLVVSINSEKGADLLQLNAIETGKELTIASGISVEHGHWYSSNWFFGFLGLLLGLTGMYVIKKRNRKIITTAIILLCVLPTASYNPLSAHDGDDHGGGKGSKTGGSSSTFMVQKETQFLFSILTQKIGTGDFNSSTVLLGTVAAAPQGRAVIQSPQTGKIVSLRANPGQQVNRGQVLAVIEQQVDAGTQINILSQKNIVTAEYEAARAQYERLKAIEDIAAKKDVTEARARFETARRNRDLFNANAGAGAASTKQISLTSPISGIVGTFNYAIGAVVSAGETIFEITNLNQVFIEAQVFTTDLVKVRSATSFTVTSNIDSLPYGLKMISRAQTVNTGNQSQKLLFAVTNPNGQFKIGENVTVRMAGTGVIRQLIVPNEAITDVNGKPAVFIKDKAEQYSISFVVKGQNNDRYTTIVKGTEAGERIVTASIYQMKMIYLNQ